jgi:DeoR/GlpR family transcriptional regulator of sugar metabolism
MLARSDMHVLLSDHGKFDTPLLERVCPLADLDVLVTDRKPPGPLARALKQAGVRIRVA